MRTKHSCRKYVLGILAATLWLAWTLPAWAERVVVMLSRSASTYNAALSGFQSTAPFKIEVFNLESGPRILADVARAVQAGNVDAIVAIGTEAVMAAGKVKTELPLVYTMVLRPITLPGRKISGVIVMPGVGEQLARIHKLLPDRTRVGMIFNPSTSDDEIKLARRTVDRFQMKLYAIPYDKSLEATGAMQKMTKDMVDIMLMLAEETLSDPQVFQQMVNHCRSEKIPLIGLSLNHVKAGAFAAFSADFQDIGAQTAEFTQTIIRGGDQNQIVTPRKIIVYVNSEVREQLGIPDLSGFPEVRQVE